VRRLEALRSDVSGARWLEGNGLHLTVKFLGEVADVDAVIAALGTVRSRLLKVSLEMRAAYPTPARARVLVFEGPSTDALAALHLRVESALHFARTEEARAFRPHVTLARLKEPDARAVRQWLTAPAPRLSFVAHELVLFESRASSAGATYEPIARVELGV
jgi:2'-5' RNA ligase